MQPRKQAVLLLAHGTPETVEQIPEYLRNVVSGRAMPQHVVEEIQHRYSLIGRSPLTDITREQGVLVEAELAAMGDAVPVYIGMRDWQPCIPEDARRTAELVAARVPEIPKWWFAFQSQGASGGPWIGPTVEETLDSIAVEGVKTLLLQPIGFLCDHVEILYDVDIAFREYAANL